MSAPWSVLASLSQRFPLLPGGALALGVRLWICLKLVPGCHGGSARNWPRSTLSLKPTGSLRLRAKP
eukprot:2708491-Rhodomonas_salina.1